jgi:hypothetical protein
MDALSPEYRFTETDQVLALPWVSYRDKLCLPTGPGLYFAIIDGREVVYIGMSATSIRARWFQHSHLAPIREQGAITIAYVEIDDIPTLKAAERLAIRSIRPVLNFNHIEGALKRQRGSRNRKQPTPPHAGG